MSGNPDENREQGAERREQSAGSREQGAGSRELLSPLFSLFSKAKALPYEENEFSPTGS